MPLFLEDTTMRGRKYEDTRKGMSMQMHHYAGDLTKQTLPRLGGRRNKRETSGQIPSTSEHAVSQRISLFYNVTLTEEVSSSWLRKEGSDLNVLCKKDFHHNCLCMVYFKCTSISNPPSLNPPSPPSIRLSIYPSTNLQNDMISLHIFPLQIWFNESA